MNECEIGDATFMFVFVCLIPRLMEEEKGGREGIRESFYIEEFKVFVPSR